MRSRASLLAVLLLGLAGSTTSAQSVADVLQRFFLVRSVEVLNEPPSCRRQGTTVAVLVLPPSERAKSGERFAIITQTGNALAATFTGSTGACSSLFATEGTEFGLLRTETRVPWPTEIQALPAVRGVKPGRHRIGALVPLADAERRRYLAAVRNRIPADHTVFVEKSAARVRPPGTGPTFVFLPVGHYDDPTYQQLGDKALTITGFLLRDDRGAPTILLAEDYLTELYAITDVDGDGIYEVLVHTGGYAGGHYAMRLFDGRRFTGPERVLYRWMD